MPNNLVGITGLTLLLLSCSTPGFLGGGSNQATSVENVSFTQQDESVYISYDLISATPGARYHVQLLLDLEDEGTYVIDSSSISGDVGPEVTPGRNNTIVWDVLQDFPQGLQRSQIKFAVTVRRERQPGKNWVYAAGAAVLLGAGVSAGMMLMGGGDSSGDSGLPSPPSRPGWK